MRAALLLALGACGAAPRPAPVAPPHLPSIVETSEDPATHVRISTSYDAGVPGAGRYRGVVLDPAGRPVFGAAVALALPTGFDTQITDEQGRYRFGNLPPGHFDVHLEYLDVDLVRRIEIRPGQELAQRFVVP